MKAEDTFKSGYKPIRSAQSLGWVERRRIPFVLDEVKSSRSPVSMEVLHRTQLYAKGSEGFVS